MFHSIVSIQFFSRVAKMRLFLLTIFLISTYLAPQRTSTEECLLVDYPFPERTLDVLIETDLAVSPNGEQLVVIQQSLYQPNIVNFYNTQSNRLYRSVDRDSDSFALSWSPNSDLLALVFRTFTLEDHEFPYNRLEIWDATGELLDSVMTESLNVAWSYSGEFIATGSINNGQGGLTIWNADSLTVSHTLEVNFIPAQISWSPINDRLAIIADLSPEIILWSIDNRTTERLEVDTPIFGFAWANTQPSILFTDGAGLYILDSETLQVTSLILSQGELSNFFDIRLSGDDRFVAIATREGLVLWDTLSESLLNYQSHSPPAYRIAWLPDMSGLYYADFDGGIYFWDISTACVTAVLTQPFPSNQTER